MRIERILREMDDETTQRNCFALGVVLADEYGEPRSDLIIFSTDEQREQKIRDSLDSGKMCLGMLAILRTRYGFVSAARHYIHQAWALRILRNATQEAAILVSADKSFRYVLPNGRIQ